MAKVYTQEEKRTRCKCGTVGMFEPMMPMGGVMTISRTVDGVVHKADTCGQYVKVK